MDLLAQKRSANFIVKQLKVPFHQVLGIWKSKAFEVKEDKWDVKHYIRLFKEKGWGTE